MDIMFPAFVDLDYFQLLDAGQPIITIKGFLPLPFSLVLFFTHKDILCNIFVIYWIFVASFDATYLVANPYMMKINRNSGQSMTTFYAGNWK